LILPFTAAGKRHDDIVTSSPPINDSKAPHLKAAAPPQRYTDQIGSGITIVQATLSPLRPATKR
jgi:hypothetical protein